MIADMSTLVDRLERGYGMRAQRTTEGLLLAATFVVGDLRPAWVVFAMVVLQAIAPIAAPIALVWQAIDRRIPPDRLGNLYFDRRGLRGAATLASLVLACALALTSWSSVPELGRILLAVPTASALLASTVGFCAGCSHYAFGLDLLVRAGLARRPEGACDVDVEG
jgi:hypothetical protein